MKITMVAVLSIAAAATALPLAAIAHADDNYQQFASPSGNIRCILNGQDTPAPIAMCQIGHHTYAAPPGSTRDGGPCEPGSDLGRDFRLDEGGPAYLTGKYQGEWADESSRLSLRSGVGSGCEAVYWVMRRVRG